MIAVDKPAGVLVYSPEHIKKSEDTLLDSVFSYLDFHNKATRNGVVHRLDRDTSGVVLFAKNKQAEKELKKLFKDRKIQKKYVALVHGKLESKEGKITIPLGRAPKDRLRVVPKASGKPSETFYRVTKYYPDRAVSLLEIDLKTGRMHQIRVHFAAIGHPVVGDKVYGRRTDKISRQFLHAKSLEFVSPFDGKRIVVKSGLSKELEVFLKKLS